jgi:hypothetical protein
MISPHNAMSTNVAPYRTAASMCAKRLDLLVCAGEYRAQRSGGIRAHK